MIAEISALIERYSLRYEAQNTLKLRKANQIKTIHSSLAIEGNTLSEAQVTDILNGKKVIAPLREIQEVKNAISAYELFPKLDPFSIEDLLKAHAAMMAALCDEAGHFRQGGVGVFDKTRVIHIAPPASRVPVLIKDLFNWLKKAEDHLLIRSCVFHYEFEFIHPFTDGNGRMGRLWQSLILTQLHPLFQHLPVETMVHEQQKKYYDAIRKSTKAGDSGAFIQFMLGEILRTLEQHLPSQSGGVSGGVSVGVGGGVALKQAVLLFCAEPRSKPEIQEHLGIKSERYVREKLINPLLAEGKLRRTEKSLNSKKQRYVTE